MDRRMDRLTLPETTSETLLRTLPGLVWRVVARAARTGDWTHWDAAISAEVELGGEPLVDATILTGGEAGGEAFALIDLLDGREAAPTAAVATSAELAKGLLHYLESLSPRERVRSVGRIVNLLHLVTQHTSLEPFAQLERLPAEDQTSIWEAVLGVLAAKDHGSGVTAIWLAHLDHLPDELLDRWVEQFEGIDLTSASRNKIAARLTKVRERRAAEGTSEDDKESDEEDDAVSQEDLAEPTPAELSADEESSGDESKEQKEQKKDEQTPKEQKKDADGSTKDGPPPTPIIESQRAVERTATREASGEMAALSPEAMLALEQHGAFERPVDKAATSDDQETGAPSSDRKRERTPRFPGVPIVASTVGAESESTDAADDASADTVAADDSDVTATHPERPALNLDDLVAQALADTDVTPPPAVEDLPASSVEESDDADHTVRWRIQAAGGDQTGRWSPLLATEKPGIPELEPDGPLEEDEVSETASERDSVDSPSTPETSTVLEGGIGGRPLPRFVRILTVITGLIVLVALIKTLARFLFGWKREGRLWIEDEQVVVESTWHLLGREIGRTHRTFGPKGLLSVAREVKYPFLYLFIGLFALCAGTLVGTMVFLDGRLAGFEEWMRVGLLLIIAGLVVDFLFAVVAGSRPGKVTLAVSFEPKTTVRIIGVDERDADQMLDRIVKLRPHDSNYTL